MDKTPELQTQHVIVLHGMGRSYRSMNRMAKHLRAAGYTVHNLGYPSTRYNIETLCEKYLPNKIKSLQNHQAIHFVTHSLGGILIRQYLQHHSLPAGSRIVMLAPPNHGSQVADKLMNWKIYQWFNGPAGQQLGTGSDSVPNQLGAIAQETGIITGNRSIYPPISWWIPGDNDGLVGVESAKLEGMQDFLVLPCGHTLIMNHKTVIKQTIQFLKSGRFYRKTT